MHRCAAPTFDDYKQVKQHNIGKNECHHHNIYTEQINKVALSADDDKRVIMDDGVNTLAHGHFKLNK
jgi:hypothetical protein